MPKLGQQVFAHELPSPINPCFDGFGDETEPFTDLTNRQLLEVAQNHHLPVKAGKGLNRGGKIECEFPVVVLAEDQGFVERVERQGSQSRALRHSQTFPAHDLE